MEHKHGFMNYSRHPDFDRRYEEMWKLLHKLTWKIAKRNNWRFLDVIGYTVIKFNAILYTYDPTKGAFSTYIFHSLYKSVLHEYRAIDSENDTYWRYQHKREEDGTVGVTALHEVHKMSYNSDMPLDINNIPAPTDRPPLTDIWGTIKAVLCPRDYKVIRQLYLEHRSTAEIARELKVSRQRVNQYKVQALAKLKEVKELECLL